jgi:hypothetical protein
MDSCFCELFGMSPALTFYFLFLSHHDFLHTSCYHALLCAYARLHDIISYAFIFNVVVSCIETVFFFPFLLFFVLPSFSLSLCHTVYEFSLWSLQVWTTLDGLILGESLWGYFMVVP